MRAQASYRGGPTADRLLPGILAELWVVGPLLTQRVGIITAPVQLRCSATLPPAKQVLEGESGSQARRGFAQRRRTTDRCIGNAARRLGSDPPQEEEVAVLRVFGVWLTPGHYLLSLLRS